MSIFGQVWLWSLLAFVTGVLLTWLILVRPVRKQVADLEDQLFEARNRPAPAPAPVADEFEVDEWEPAPSLADEVLLSSSRVDELTDDRPRSLHERLSPADEQPRVVPAFVPGAEVAPADHEPMAPAEVDAPVDDFIYQPREVWAEQEQEAFLDEAAEQEDDAPKAAEETSLIPVVDSEDQWPENDLTGEYAGLQDHIANRLSGGEEEPEPVAVAEQTTYLQPVEEAADDETASEQTLIQQPVEAEGWRPGAAYAAPEEAAKVSEVSEEEAYQQTLESAQSAGFGGAHEATTFTEPVGEVEEPAATWPEPVVEEDPVEPEAPAAFAPFAKPAEDEHPTYEPFAEAGEPAVKSAFDPFAAVTPVDPDAEAFAPVNGSPLPAPEKPEPQPVVERPRSLFEPIVDADEPLTETKRPEVPAAQDQPFVPKFVPGPPLSEQSAEPVEAESDLPRRETAAGLPRREARRSTPPRPTQTQTPAPQPAAAAPAPVRPQRPRPVGFSPSTGGVANGSSTTRYQQPEGFNPRSPFGPGSVLPKSDGLAPAPDFEVKATLTGRRYFTHESANFKETRADVWFRTIADAQKAGFRPAP